MILITGGSGQLGNSLQKNLKQYQMDYVAPSHQELDVSNYNSVKNYIEKFHPDSIIHCAAFSQVDLAEEEKEECFRTNVIGTEILTELSKQEKSYFIYISTDYVFDGKKTGLYEIYDKKNPLSFYGKTKSEAEDIVKNKLENSSIVRTSWLFGPSKNNFVEAILKKSQQRNILDVVHDQIGSPTYTEDLSFLLIDMLNKKTKGIIHGTNEGFCSWAEFAEKILLFSGISSKVNRVSSDHYPSKVIRPKNSKLSKESLILAGLSKLPYWENALLRYLKERKEANFL